MSGRYWVHWWVLLLEKSPIAAIQLLWVNLIQDSLASLALASDSPSDELLNRPPVNRSKDIITKRMWFNILGQGCFQLTVILVLLFSGDQLFALDTGNHDDTDDGESVSEHYTVIFNSYVWMNLFNQINCRKLNGECWVFGGIFSNPLFLIVLSVEAILQILIVQCFGVVFKCEALDLKYWGLSIGLGALSLPMQQIINLIYRITLGFSFMSGKRHQKEAEAMYKDLSSSSMRYLNLSKKNLYYIDELSTTSIVTSEE